MMKQLEMSNFGVLEMQQEEMRETDGGGWLSDAIAAVIGQLKCDCHSPTGEYHDAMRSSNYGGIR